MNSIKIPNAILEKSPDKRIDQFKRVAKLKKWKAFEVKRDKSGVTLTKIS